MDKLQTFLNKAKAIHEDKYDYSKVEYVTAHVPITIICKIHGEFKQAPMAHTGQQKQGCPKCGLENRKSPNQKTTAQFIIEATEKWKDKYDYSITKYVKKETKIKYICKEHGEQEQKPYLHIKNGCQFCAGRGISKYTNETFIKKANEVHNNFYNYDKVDIKSINDKVIITCPVHGDFPQKASNHINIKNGCPKCNGGVSINNEEYISKAILKHGNKFNYSLTEYSTAHNKINILCEKHGKFEQMAYTHLATTHCCPVCVAELTSSQAEKDIVSFIKEYYNGLIKTNDRNILDHKEIDILIPEFNLGIEFNGNYWHTEAVVGKKYHLYKTNLAEKNNIKLIQIFENEWNNKKEIVKSRILSQLGLSKKIHARKTSVITLKKEEKNNFLEETHIQGKDNSSICFGLKYENELAACMTFGKPRFGGNYNYELIRYSSKLNTSVVGGASKLLNAFKKEYTGIIVSYADRKWSTGNMYEKLGFIVDGKTDPGYVYYHINKKTVHNRLNFQKHRLINMPFYDVNLSEYEIMKLNGYERIWDCGNIRCISK